MLKFPHPSEIALLLLSMLSYTYYFMQVLLTNNVKWGLSNNQLISQHSNGPYVHFLIITMTAE